MPSLPASRHLIQGRRIRQVAHLLGAGAAVGWQQPCEHAWDRGSVRKRVGRRRSLPGL